ncbi:hypothetical protein L195_g047092, partial [Trifolium pratense]
MSSNNNKRTQATPPRQSLEEMILKDARDRIVIMFDDEFIMGPIKNDPELIADVESHRRLKRMYYNEFVSLWGEEPYP